MDSLSLIVTALVTGASAGLSDSAKNVVLSAYDEMRALLRARLERKGRSTDVLEPQLDDTEQWELALKEELAAAELGSDEILVAHARRLLELCGSAADTSSTPTRYQASFHGPVGTAVVGDNTKVNVTIRKMTGSDHDGASS
jgi:hypothetical protein